MHRNDVTESFFIYKYYKNSLIFHINLFLGIFYVKRYKNQIAKK